MLQVVFDQVNQVSITARVTLIMLKLHVLWWPVGPDFHMGAG